VQELVMGVVVVVMVVVVVVEQSIKNIYLV
jgi:hypothetical protein